MLQHLLIFTAGGVGLVYDHRAIAHVEADIPHPKITILNLVSPLVRPQDGEHFDLLAPRDLCGLKNLQVLLHHIRIELERIRLEPCGTTPGRVYRA